MTIAVLGTLDSKGHEHAFVADFFHDAEAYQALFHAIHVNAQCEVVDFDKEINNEVFAQAAAHKLLKLIGKSLTK